MTNGDSKSGTARAVRIVCAINLALLLLIHVHAVWKVRARPLDHDEAEYLHASWLMSEGQKIYRDFMEDHPPFLYSMLHATQPAAPSPAFPHGDVLRWTVRSRLLMGVFSLVTLLSIAGIAWRTARGDLLAPLLAVGFIIGGRFTWSRGLGDIRADSPTLALFWLGAWLLIRDRARSSAAAALQYGTGIALLLASEIWNPKYPLEALVLGLWFLWSVWPLVRERWTNAVAAFAPSIAVVALSLLAILATASLRDYVYFNFILKAANMKQFVTNQWVVAYFTGWPLFGYAPEHARGIWVAFALLPLLALLIRRVRQLWDVDLVRAGLLLILVATSLIEVRFLYSYPRLWPQYFLMWSMTLALAYGLVPSAVIAFGRAAKEAFRSRWIAPATVVATIAAAGFASRAMILLASGMGWEISADAQTMLAVTFISGVIGGVGLVIGAYLRRAPAFDVLVAGVQGVAIALVMASTAAGMWRWTRFPAERQAKMRWEALAFLQQRMKADDTVWLTATTHPIAANDASYFWYSFQDLTPMTLHYLQTTPASAAFLPRITANDLPPCALDRNPRLRFLEVSPWLRYFPEACRCTVSLLNEGRLVPTPVVSIIEVKRPDTPSYSPDEVMWYPIFRQRVLPTYCNPHAGLSDVRSSGPTN